MLFSFKYIFQIEFTQCFVKRVKCNNIFKMCVILVFPGRFILEQVFISPMSLKYPI